MDNLWWIILIPLVIAGLAAMGAGSELDGVKRKFANLGTIAGKSKSDIVEAVGPPNSFSGMAGGKTLLQWQHTSQAGAYHIALIFDEHDICEGITHEYAS